MVMRMVVASLILLCYLTVVSIVGASTRHLFGSLGLDVLVGLGVVMMLINTYFIASFIVIDETKSQKKKEEVA